MLSTSHCNRVVTGALLLAAGILAPNRASAQSGGGSDASMEETPAQQLASAPAPGGYEASATLGFQFKAGRTETRDYSIDALIAYRTQHGMLLRLDAEFTREEFRPAPDAELLTVENGFEASLTTLQPISDWLLITGVGSWRRDAPLDLDHRVMGQAGLAFQVASPRVEFMVGPLVGAGSQNNASSATSDGIVNLGGIQALTWHVTQTFVIQDYLAAHQNLDNSTTSPSP